MKLTVLYGTESGNAELVAEDIGEQLREAEHDVEVSDLQDFDPADLTPERFLIVVCSTHGDGGLPDTAIPFAAAFDRALPNLTGVRYAMFGLGDSFYQATYSQGSEHIDRRFTAQGAIRIGEYGRHDASSGTIASDVALAWLPSALATAQELATAQR